MKARLRVIAGQPSWRLATAQVEAFVTEKGGHLGPVTFLRGHQALRPYSVAPWAEERCVPALPPILAVLRGDFFCLPFGGNATSYRGERHPLHGETANAQWQWVGLERAPGRQCLHLRLRPRVRKGCVDKRLWLVEGHHAVYCQHAISGMGGPMTFGHHAMLRFPDRPGSGLLSTSPFEYGQVFFEPTERPENCGYSWLQPGAEFSCLTQVPTIVGAPTDVTVFPARRGYEDLVMIAATPGEPLAWTAVSFPRERYVWFALKDPRVLRNTIFWLSNGGRHYPPWNGRHVNVLGIEDVTSYFHLGLAESVRLNAWSAKGHPTCVTLTPEQPCVVNYIMAVVRTPAGFGRVCRIEPSAGRDSVRLQAEDGKAVLAPLDVGFLTSAPPPAA